MSGVKLSDFLECPDWYCEKYTKQALTSVIWPAFRYAPYCAYIIGSRDTEEGRWTYFQDQDTGEVSHTFEKKNERTDVLSMKDDGRPFHTAKDYHMNFVSGFEKRNKDTPINQLVDDSWFRKKI